MANITPQKLYTTRQKPFAWRWFAKRLMAAAEIILADQAQAAQVFNEALREACAELDQKKATGAQPLKAIVRAQKPNYLPAQLLYAFAIENAVKGLCVARDPSLAENEKLTKFLKQHELNTLIAETGVQMSDAELQFLDKVTHVIKWAGRYPVAENISQHKEGIHPIHSPDRILGSSEDANEKLREIFNNLIKELEKHAPENDDNFGVVVELS